MGFDRGAITNQGSAWAEVCMHQAHTKPWLITSLNVRREWLHFFCFFILCSQCPSSIKTKAEECNQCLHWIQKVRRIFVLFSWLKAPSVPLIDNKQKLCYTTHGCCLCALKCVFGLHWPWGHIFFCCRKKLSSHVENCQLNVELKYQGANVTCNENQY